MVKTIYEKARQLEIKNAQLQEMLQWALRHLHYPGAHQDDTDFVARRKEAQAALTPADDWLAERLAQERERCAALVCPMCDSLEHWPIVTINGRLRHQKKDAALAIMPCKAIGIREQEGESG
jgi:hypothetical protein